MINESDKTMMDAAEVLHYANKHKDLRLVICFTSQIRLADFIMDLRILQNVGCSVVILTTSVKVPEFVQTLKGMDMPLEEYSLEKGQDIPALAADTPVMQKKLIHLFQVRGDYDFCEYYDLAFRLSQSCGARKLLGVETNPQGRLQLQNNKFLFELQVDELRERALKGDIINYSKEELLFIHDCILRYGIELVFLWNVSGAIFREIFTLSGFGTMISTRYRVQMRRGELEDIMQLVLIMTPYLRSGVLLPLAEKDLIANIHNYYVYVIDGTIVACATLVEYEDFYELSKFCALPRYQGKGRAQDLAQFMLEVAHKQGKKAVFALSKVPKVGDFFRGLGFKDISRHELPQAWGKDYDFSRPSSAYIYYLPPAD